MKLSLQAASREVGGKQAKKIRAEGMIPAELYGQGEANQHLAVKIKEFENVFKAAGESTVVYLDIKGKETPVLIYDTDANHITGEWRNVDFYRVNMAEKVTANVPFVFKGESQAVRDFGAILVTVLNEVEIEALPQDLPHEIEIDLALLTEIGKSVHLKDLALPKSVEIKEELDAVIVTVKEQKQEKEEVAAPVDVSAVAVEGEKKPEETAKEGDKK